MKPRTLFPRARQDVALGYGRDVSRSTQGKRVVPNVERGPLMATE